MTRQDTSPLLRILIVIISGVVLVLNAPVMLPLGLTGRAALPAVLLTFLVVVLAAVAWRPWHTSRTLLLWVVTQVGILHAFTYLFHGVGYTTDAAGYLEGISLVASGQVSYFPPGYSLFLAPAWLVTSVWPGYLAVGVQHVLMITALLCVRSLVCRIVGDDWATLALVIAGSAAPTLMTPQMIFSENVAIIGMAGALWFASQRGANGALRRDAAAGLLVGAAGLARVIPIVVVAVPLFLVFRSNAGNRAATIRTARTLAVATSMVLMCSAWFYAGSGRFALSDSAGLHLYNRVVTEQGLLDRQGAATSTFLARFGDRPIVGIPHWDVTPELGRQGLSYVQAEALMRQVSMEGIRSDPAGFLRFSLMLTLRTYAVAPAMEARAVGTPPIATLESPVPARLRATHALWWTRSEGAFRRLWTVLCWMPVLGLALLPFMRERLVFLALLAVPAVYLFMTALAELFVPRYVAGILPFALMLSTVPLAILVRAAPEP